MRALKIILPFVAIMFFQTIIAQETITNESVMQMVDLGFSDDVIVDKINSSDVSFNTTIAELSKLKNANVSSGIISLIMEKSKHNTKSRTGIYYADGKESKLLHPTVFSGGNTNSAANKLVSGFINKKERAVLPRTKSNNVLNSQGLEFTFVFDPSVTEVDNLQSSQGDASGISNWWFRTASSPNEFVLVKLTVKDRKNVREVITGKKSWVSSQDGVDPKYALPFSIEEIEANKFKVVPENLGPGEYAFLYQGQVPDGRSNQSVFDFSIQ